MLWGEYEPKGDGAACVVGCGRQGRCLYENVSGKRIVYGWRKRTVERSFAEAKENHGLRYARMLGIANMREQCFLTAAVQNIERLVASLQLLFLYFPPSFLNLGLCQ